MPLFPLRANGSTLDIDEYPSLELLSGLTEERDHEHHVSVLMIMYPDRRFWEHATKVSLI